MVLLGPSLSLQTLLVKTVEFFIVKKEHFPEMELGGEVFSNIADFWVYTAVIVGLLCQSM